MQALHPKEISCLRQLAECGGEASAPCDVTVLEALVLAGLVERVKASALPLESPVYKYRLTPAGRQYYARNCLGKD